MAQYFEPLILAAIGAASKTPNHQQQMNLLDQTKTLAESALQMLYTAKEAGGNPKVSRRCMWQQCEPQTFVTCHTCMLGTKIHSKCLVSLLGGSFLLSFHLLLAASCPDTGGSGRSCADDEGGCGGH